MRVAIATCEQFPELEDDDRLLLPALAARGVEGVPSVWSDAGVDWSGFDAVVLRSTWDYCDHRPQFLRWLASLDAVTRVVNPAALVEWNTDKTYLRHLADAGVPVVATQFLDPGTDLATWRPPAGAAEFVVKPSVSAGSRNTMRYRAESAATARAHIDRLLAEGRTVMVQPYLDAVDDRGETALLYFDGRFSHAIRKGPLLLCEAEGNRVADLYLEEDISPRTPTEEELAVGDRVLAAIPGGLVPAYARVDLVPGPDGAPLLLELELTEPSVFLAHAAGAADRLAAALMRALGQG